MKAYVLAAGYATRLGAIARTCPKPLLEVAGRPALSHIVDRLAGLRGLSEVVVVTNARFHADFEDWAARYESSVPIRVLDNGSTRAENRRGATADLAFGLETVPPGGAPWVAAAGDNLLDFDLEPLQRRFLESTGPMLLLRKHVDESAGLYNEVTLGEGGQVLRFREKPELHETGVTAIAMYFFTPEVTALLQAYLAAGHEPDATGHFVGWLVERAPVRGAFFDGAWFDLGDRDSLERARRSGLPSPDASRRVRGASARSTIDPTVERTRT